MNYDSELLEILIRNYEQNLEILENQDPKLLNNSDFHKLYRAYWLSNINLKNIIDLMDLNSDMD